MAGPKKKVLVIDDDKVIHTVLKAALEKAGFQPFAALDAMQGTMMAKQIRPDLIILDIMMPAGGGLKVYESLQMMAGSFQVPFIIYSSMDRNELVTKIPENGQTVILSKVTPLDQLIAAANRLTGQA